MTFAHLHQVTAARHPYINTESTRHLQFGSFCNALQRVCDSGRCSSFSRFISSRFLSHFRERWDVFLGQNASFSISRMHPVSLLPLLSPQHRPLCCGCKNLIISLGQRTKRGRGLAFKLAEPKTRLRYRANCFAIERCCIRHNTATI